MLKAIGAPTAVAHNIVDGWPTCEDHRRAAPSLELSLPEEGAYRLVCFIRNLEDHDWPALIESATKDAAKDMSKRAAAT